LQRIFQREHQVTGYVVSSQQQNRESIDRLCREIRRLSRLADAQPTREFFDTAIEARLAQAMAWLTSAVALIVGSIGMLNTMWMGVVERTQEIAALRAIGWRRWSVMRLVLLESMLLAASGAVLGTLAAIGLTWLLSRHPAVQNLVSSSTDPLTIVQALAIATAICALGGAYPAYRASQLAPAEGLRHE
jgi:putative ABC transport system permease protein